MVDKPRKARASATKKSAAAPESSLTDSLKGLDAQRKQALDFALQQIHKKCGQGSIMMLGDQESRRVDVIHTGSLSLDKALGIGGLPRSRVVEVYGPESSGKTTLTLHAIANAQKNGGVAAFIDAEHALDPTWAKRLGVNLEDLLVSQPSESSTSAVWSGSSQYPRMTQPPRTWTRPILPSATGCPASPMMRTSIPC